MAIQYSGNLLVKVRQRPFAGLLAGAQPLAIQGYRLEPLFKRIMPHRCFRLRSLQITGCRRLRMPGAISLPGTRPTVWLAAPSIRFMSSRTCRRRCWRFPRLPRNRDLIRIDRPQRW